MILMNTRNNTDHSNQETKIIKEIKIETGIIRITIITTIIAIILITIIITIIIMIEMLSIEDSILITHLLKVFHTLITWEMTEILDPINTSPQVPQTTHIISNHVITTRWLILTILMMRKFIFVQTKVTKIEKKIEEDRTRYN